MATRSVTYLHLSRNKRNISHYSMFISVLSVGQQSAAWYDTLIRFNLSLNIWLDEIERMTVDGGIWRDKWGALTGQFEQCLTVWYYGSWNIKFRTTTWQKGQTFITQHLVQRGPGNVVGIATGYGLDGPGIEFRWRRDFSNLSRPALGPTQHPVQWVPSLYRG